MGISVYERESVSLDYAKITELAVKDINANPSVSNRTFTRENIETYLSNPKRYSIELQNVSATLYDKSLHYKRLINYFASITTLDYYVDVSGLDLTKNINEKTLKNNYQKTLDLLEFMNIKHEFGKALVSAWKLGTFYGYELYTKDSYFIQELPYDFCQISGIADGVYTFSFDVSYFDRNTTQLNMYPQVFVSMYNSFKNGSKPKWQEVDPANSVCIKINEEVYHDLPPFAGLFTEVYDIEDYKSIRKSNTIVGNYKFLSQKIPMRDKSERNNDFLVDLNTVGMFHNKTANLLPEEIGIFSTPFDIETIQFDQDRSEKDKVQEAEDGFYSASGTSSLLFNGNKSSNANLTKSINVDEAEAFRVLRQLERIINGKIKNEIKGAFNFRIKFLDNTIFNRKENTDELLKVAQYGLPVKSMLCASLGMSPSSVASMAYIENQVLGLHDLFVPLSSSHTQSAESSSENGRPKADEDSLSEKGEEQRDRGDNDNRA